MPHGELTDVAGLVLGAALFAREAFATRRLRRRVAAGQTQ
jgi:hypothetical protein